MGVIDLLFNRRKDILERNLTDGRIFMAENAERRSRHFGQWTAI